MLSQIDYASSKLEIYKNNTVYKEYDISIVLQKLEEIQSKDIGSD
jgi:hypothetical protein